MISDSATTDTIAPPNPCAVSPRRGTPASRQPHASDVTVNSASPQGTAPAPEQVAEPPAEQQEAAEGEQVGVDHPGQRRLGEAEVRRIEEGRRSRSSSRGRSGGRRSRHVEGEPSLAPLESRSSRRRLSGGLGSRHARQASASGRASSQDTLEPEQVLLALAAACIAPERSARAEHAMAWNNDRNRVRAERVAGRADRARAPPAWRRRRRCRCHRRGCAPSRAGPCA